MTGPASEPARVEVKSRAELRAWLAKHHATSPSVWLVTWKKHTAHYLDYGPLIEELLCWGWVDSRSRGVDADRTSVLISPRNPKSAWSAANKAKVAAARASGAMTPAGEALIATAQANGMWEFLDEVEALIQPADLKAALDAEAARIWEGYPNSIKRAALEWLKTARTPPTRARRIADIVTSAGAGLRPTPFRR